MEQTVFLVFKYASLGLVFLSFLFLYDFVIKFRDLTRARAWLLKTTNTFEKYINTSTVAADDVKLQIDNSITNIRSICDKVESSLQMYKATGTNNFILFNIFSIIQVGVIYTKFPDYVTVPQLGLLGLTIFFLWRSGNVIIHQRVMMSDCRWLSGPTVKLLNHIEMENKVVENIDKLNNLTGKLKNLADVQKKVLQNTDNNVIKDLKDEEGHQKQQ